MPMARRGAGIVLPVMLLLGMLLSTHAAGGADGPDAAKAALSRSLTALGEAKGSPDLLVLTNAAYARLDGKTAERFLDDVTEVTGASLGSRSLLSIHSSMLAPFWFSLYSKNKQKIVFCALKDGAFASQEIDAAPDALLAPDNWKTIRDGLIGSRLFSVASISLAWTGNPDFMALQAASFHDHFCPGVNYGLIMGDYIEKNFPLGPDDRYVFAVAPSNCAADALQVMYNTTTGKGGDYGMGISKEQQAAYALNGITPSAVVLRVNTKKDVCDALALGIDSARLYADMKLDEADLAPPGGQQNPLFHITRVRASRELCRMPKEKRIGYVVELKKMSGKASLAGEITANDPYAPIWGR
ncbi:MAG: FmdE family protein [Thermodesulfobacteriota bacterium]